MSTVRDASSAASAPGTDAAEHSDEALAAEAAAGRGEAFDELVRRYQRRVRHLVRRLGGDERNADDLAQDIFIRAYRGIARFRGESAFWSWLYRIAVNVILDHRGRLGRAETLVLELGDEPHDAGHDVATSEDLELRVIRRQAIERALASLPAELRALLILREVEGLKYEEIARMMGLPRGTVDSRLSRARRKLRPMLVAILEEHSDPVLEEKPDSRSLTQRRLDRIR